MYGGREFVCEFVSTEMLRSIMFALWLRSVKVNMNPCSERVYILQLFVGYCMKETGKYHNHPSKSVTELEIT